MTTEIVLPTLPKHVKKPDDVAFKKELETLNVNIDKLKKQSDAIKEKINKLPAKTDNSRREDIKKELSDLRDKQAGLKQDRQTVYQQLDAINNSIRKKVSDVKSFQQRVPFKTVADVDVRIKELEQKIESGGARLVEEKKMLQEVSLLKRSRAQVEGLDEQQAAIDRERGILNEIKKNIDDSEAKKLSKRYEDLNEEFTKLNTNAKEERESRNKLYDERTRLKGLLDAEFDKLRSLRDEHRKANDEYFTFVRQYREAKRELERQRKIQQDQERKQEKLKEELELAALPAFEHEINLCDNLANFLQQFLDKSSGDVTPASTPTPTSANARQPEPLPEGMILSKKTDENYFVGSKKKGKKSSAKKEVTGDDASLKIPLPTMEGFFQIKVTIPTKVSEIPVTLDKLKERKQFYIEEQPKQTEANKQRAQEKINALLQKEKEEEESQQQEAQQDAEPAVAVAEE
ncbi:hypothetical protein DM01DRAFT_1409544 [Hesseltinella vesiculosa]|uniref:Nuclear segregation protein Bfr1 n=1 Tax=Hesseltinella vesiculosa TaxID=101127 RepID=A0A1X2GAA9_9FUNG|nr:hypothetical protein DM01DRAFT_1409544 [Hesseltinella vesiculosa]